jgi:cobalt/nickel transport system permease protein
MAIVPVFGGWALFGLFRRVLPSDRGGVIGATALASGVSVVLAAAMFSLQWLFGASAPVAFDTVFGAMVGVHVLIGVGEGVISAVVVGAVLASRPDLVVGARDLDAAQLADDVPVGTRTFAMAAVLVAVFLAMVVSQFAVSSPDGLERVAEDHGFAESAREHVFANGLFADYATRGIGNAALSLAVAGLAGVAVTLLVGVGLMGASRDARLRLRR